MSELLLHICCGPCASASIGFWRDRGLRPTGFFYNPNIHPLLEFRRRLTGARDVAEITGIALVEDLEYDPSGWFGRVLGAAGRRDEQSPAGRLEPPMGRERCRRCIGMRLERAAAEARARGSVAFATTLTISPYQDHQAIKSAGRAAAAAHDVEFVYEDVRALYSESRRLSREWGIFRQKYCGCILSEWERYRDTPPRGAGAPRRSASRLERG
jgi:predicted adenine nucleotide alpha hydrolase (AANH) superfamily ATPase